ncbi:hypothetical protein SNE40_012428 [Patella caerulea]|uniref:receptor protein-tyrosine kinase n=1 Tax=Patella caerulea TaxID=87958 RepID=A0AAN8PQL0_PATCE
MTALFLWFQFVFIQFYLVNSEGSGCDVGSYGPHCSYKCSEGCLHTCDPDNGVCEGGCKNGWVGLQCDRTCVKFRYGANCVRSCGSCANDKPCDPLTGDCPIGGCVPGWIGDKCDQVCEPFTYGANCNMECGKCRLKMDCNKMSGECSGGCEPGYKGKTCSERCPNKSYGVDCMLTCGHCLANTSCNHDTGHCLKGCAPGWTGIKCTQRCQAGHYGRGCLGTCGICVKGTCDHVTGYCNQGCARGWGGFQCQSECEPGSYGNNCSQSCGHCKKQTSCHSVNGICSGCEPGWRGVYCMEECEAGFYGENCKFRCGQCKEGTTCNSMTGYCPDGCQPGWLDNTCSHANVESSDTVDLKPILPFLIVAMVVVVAALSCMSLYFLVIRPKLRSKPNRLQTASRAEDDPERVRNTYEHIQGSQWEIARSNLVITNQQLGNGHFGEVKKGFIKERGRQEPVAIKSLKDNASEKDKTDFLNELNIWKKVGKHPNVVCLVGACHIRGVMYVAMEYARYGDLRTFLRRSRKNKDHHTYANMASTLRQTTLLKFALDTVSGLAYIAEKGIIHRDVAARNVLLADHLTAKIADFGLSKNDDTYVKTSRTRVPVRWMAVESLFNNTYTTKSDVWGFGILLWEIFTLGGTPYACIDTQQLFNFLKDGYRLKKPSLCDQNLYAMMLQCWNERPERRPTFPEIQGRLQRIIEDSQVYMNINTEDESQYAEIDTVKDTEDNKD